MGKGELLGEAFRAVATAAGMKIAVKDEQREVSYAELLTWADNITTTLAAAGVSPGVAVGVMIPNSASFVAAFFGAARAGAVVAPLSVRYRSQELEFYLTDSAAVALLVDPALAGVAAETVAAMEPRPALVAIDADNLACSLITPGTVQSVSSAPADMPLLHQYTSGSTGRPKRVVRTHVQLLTELERLASKLGANAGDRFLGVAPFSHVNGLVRSMMHSMFLGATLHPIAEFHRRAAIDLIERERITYLGAVPQIFVALGQTALRESVDFSSLRIVFSSSAPLLSEDNQRFFDKYEIHARQLYGSTETGTMSVNMDQSIVGTLDSVGTPLEGVGFEIRAEDGRKLRPGEEGDIVVASETAITGYGGNAKATAESFDSGFYLTGDLGFIDDGGRLYLTGRKKFLINRGGFKINPLEVEKAILSFPAVDEVVVYATAGAHGDDVVSCAIVANSACSAKEIVEHCSPLIADYKIPSRIEFRDGLPKSVTGKILRNEL